MMDFNTFVTDVMYNVDQQLFEYCTAKFADNTQCCHPVIDLKHELPLCMVHGLKAVSNFRSLYPRRTNIFHHIMESACLSFRVSICEGFPCKFSFLRQQIRQL